GPRLFDSGTKREANAGGNDALNAVDLLLLHKLAKSFNGIFRRRFILDDQLDFAATNTVLGIKTVDSPLRGTDAIETRRCRNPGARCENPDPQWLVLRNRRRQHTTRHGDDANSGRGRK